MEGTPHVRLPSQVTRHLCMAASSALWPGRLGLTYMEAYDDVRVNGARVYQQ